MVFTTGNALVFPAKSELFFDILELIQVGRSGMVIR